MEKIREAIETAQESVQVAGAVGTKTMESDMALRAGLALLPSLRKRLSLKGVAEAAFSPDARTVAARVGDGFQIFDAETLKQDGVAPRAVPRNVPASQVFAVNDGGEILAVKQAARVLLFNTKSGMKLCEFQVPILTRIATFNGPDDDVIKSLSLSPDGSYVAVAALYRMGSEVADFAPEHMGVVSLWRVDTRAGKESRVAVLINNFDSLSQVAFGPGGSVLAASGRGATVLWDLASVRGKVQARARAHSQSQPEAAASAASMPAPVSNDYQGATDDDFQKVLVPQDGDVTSVAPGTDLKQFASAIDDKVTVWRRTPVGGYEPSAYLPLPRPAGGLSLIDGDGRLFVLGVGDDASAGNVYEAWDIRGYTTAASIAFKEKFISLWFDDKDLLRAVLEDDVGQQSSGCVWPFVKAEGEADEKGACVSQTALSFQVVEKDGGLYVHRLPEGKDYPLPPNVARIANATYSFSEDGSLMALLPYGSDEREVLFFGFDKNAYWPRGSIKDYDNSQSAPSLRMTRDGSGVVYRNSAGKLSGAKINATRPPTPIRFDDFTKVSDLQLSPHGNYLAATGTGTCRNVKSKLSVFRLSDGKCVGAIPDEGELADIIFSDDETHFAANGGKTVFVLNTATGKLAKYQHTNTVHKIAFSPQAETLATVSTARGENSTARTQYNPRESIISLFDVKEGAEAVRLFQSERVELLAFNRDGKYLATAGTVIKVRADDTSRVKVWDVMTGDLVEEATTRLKCIAGNSTRLLSTREAIEYCNSRWMN
ncbi:MAG TPA: WD40 repeat domain-containing protein [Pyrinomonadaceae bacterium]